MAKKSDPRAMRNEVVLGSLFLTDTMAACAADLPPADYDRQTAVAKRIVADFIKITTDDSNLAVCMALSSLLLLSWRGYQEQQREQSRVVIPEDTVN